MSAYFEQTLLEEEFKKRRAKLQREETYFNKGSDPKYFTDNRKGTEAVMKLIHHHGRVRDLIRYVTDKEKTGDDDHVYDKYGQVIGKDKLAQKEKFWHKRNQEGSRNNSVYSTHIIFSTKESSKSKKNIEILRSAVAEVLDAHFTANNFDSIFTIHTDKSHLHAHVVVHNKNLLTNKKIRFSKYSSIFTMRKNFADCLQARGWDYRSTLRKDSLEVINGLDSAVQNKAQNYVLNQVENDLGTDARDWTKKQFISKYSENDKKAKEARANLRLVNKKEDPAARDEILGKVKLYKRQKEKWQVKQFMHNKYKNFDKKDLNKFVDSVFAVESKFSSQYHSKNSNSRTPEVSLWKPWPASFRKGKYNPVA